MAHNVTSFFLSTAACQISELNLLSSCFQKGTSLNYLDSQIVYCISAKLRHSTPSFEPKKLFHFLHPSCQLFKCIQQTTQSILLQPCSAAVCPLHCIFFIRNTYTTALSEDRFTPVTQGPCYYPCYCSDRTRVSPQLFFLSPIDSCPIPGPIFTLHFCDSASTLIFLYASQPRVCHLLNALSRFLNIPLRKVSPQIPSSPISVAMQYKRHQSSSNICRKTIRKNAAMHVTSPAALFSNPHL